MPTADARRACLDRPTGSRLRSSGTVMTSRTFSVACALLCSIGFGRQLRHAWVVHQRPQVLRADARYAPLAAALPPSGRLAFVSDLPRDSDGYQKRFYGALYALSPRVLVPEDHELRFAVVDAAAREFLDAIVARGNVRVVASSAAGPVLLERLKPLPDRP
jgi:hypothetical protein